MNKKLGYLFSDNLFIPLLAIPISKYLLELFRIISNYIGQYPDISADILYIAFVSMLIMLFRGKLHK